MPLLFDEGPGLAVEDFRMIRDLINRFCGIYFSDDARTIVARRLRERLDAVGLRDFGAYYQYLRYHPDAATELENAVEVLTTNETYFFREEYQLRAFRDEILPQLKARAEERGTRRLALWSAGCSSGEEAYTLGILVEDSGLFKGWDVRIYGNDISRRVLHKARRAVYTDASFRTTDRRYLQYFVDVPDGRQVHPHIRAMCHFGHLNLLDHSRTAIVGRVDAVFCRNVLIYFDAESRRRAIDTFYHRLVAGGYLLLGHSESLLNASTAFELVHVSTDLVYRRPAPHLFRAFRKRGFMRHLRVLVVDDSAYNRRTISELLTSLPAVEVIGKAGDGDEALRMVAELQPDLITLDLEMPRMDGFTFLRLMMARRPTPVIVVSGYSAKENVFRALEMGALDFVAKPTRTVTSDLSGISAELAEKVEVVRQLSPAGLDLHARVRGSGEVTLTPRRGAASDREPSRLIVIGSSTGGPTALVEVFRRLPTSTTTAVVVAQHMPERFTKTFAERLDKIGGMRVAEASDVHHLTAGTAFICPGGRCMELVQLQRGLGVKVVAPDAGDRYVPSVDRLFESAARVFGASTVGVVLTGMGDDGARGVVALRDAGGIVMAEAPETAVIYGMPGAAVRTGAVDRSLPLRAMAERLAELTSA